MKIGIFGGTFNPIHIGHAIIANYLAQNSCLDAIWMMVAPQNPLKKDEKSVITDIDRIKMVEMVTRHIDNVTTSAFEFSMPRPSYTFLTLQELKARFPGDEFYLIIGADNWANFHKWRCHEEIIANFQILVYPRLGFEVNIPEEVAHHVSLVDAPVIELSSTQIREGLRQQRNMNFYLSSDVYEYILKNKLYL
ncbi:MAG: nicotinate (nicotinamide) nucleotide adenylyltransferase [Muribaculaceae bacterium]